jgi:tRNA(Ile)-lysidine synthase
VVRVSPVRVARVSPVRVVRVACSGGADSLALAAGLAWLDAHEPDPLRRSSALVIDHGLQAGSAGVAARVVQVLHGLGLDASSFPVQVARGPDGLEASARNARYAALTSGDVDVVLLGHTMDDQAETVLLGLARGSGTRSLAGMPAAWSTPARADAVADAGLPDGLDRQVTLIRPLLGLRRSATRQACLDWGLTPWEDPMNDDPSFARVRARRLLPIMEDALGPGLVEALARTAVLATADADYLDAAATRLWSGDADVYPSRDLDALSVDVLLGAADALRGRIVKDWLKARGVTELTYERTRAVLALALDWRGQAGVDVPGGRRVVRDGPRLWLR